jgi:hypothetical protein
VATLAALGALLVLPLWVLRGGLGEWPSRLATFKALALALTVVYFAFGVVWLNERERRRGDGGS